MSEVRQCVLYCLAFFLFLLLCDVSVLLWERKRGRNECALFWLVLCITVTSFSQQSVNSLARTVKILTSKLVVFLSFVDTISCWKVYSNMENHTEFYLFASTQWKNPLRQEAKLNEMFILLNRFAIIKYSVYVRCKCLCVCVCVRHRLLRAVCCCCFCCCSESIEQSQSLAACFSPVFSLSLCLLLVWWRQY